MRGDPVDREEDPQDEQARKESVCEGWHPQDDEQLCDEQLRANLKAERRAAKRFFTKYYYTEVRWSRGFCGGMVLHPRTRKDTEEPYSPNAPIWNILVSAAIMPDHVDIDSPKLVSFVRQLYNDESVLSCLKLGSPDTDELTE